MEADPRPADEVTAWSMDADPRPADGVTAWSMDADPRPGDGGTAWSMDADPRPGDAVTRLVDAVVAVSGGFTAQGDALVADLGLTAARWLLLGALQDGPATIAAVARRRGLRRQSAREGMERLERAGLVARSPNPADARAPLFTLTGAGRAALAEIEPRRAAWARDLERTLDPAALATTLTLLAEVRASLGSR